MSDQQKWIAEAMRATNGCPPAEELALILDAAADARRSRIESHVNACVHCQGELSLLRDFMDAKASPEDAASVQWVTDEVRRRVRNQLMAEAPTPWWKRWLMIPITPRLAMAAASLLIVAGTSLYISQLRNPALGPGPAEGSQVYRSQAIRLEAPKGDVTEPPAALVWQPMAGAVRYQARLMEVDRVEMWKQDGTSTRVQLPSAIRAKALPGKTLLWQVVAFDAAGTKIAESSIERFRVAVPER